jgi:ubiquinone/menaquinone biosynthesis C-methylase UbiE
MTQVGKSHYDFKKYCRLDRWSSYHYQLREILAGSPESVLEIGVGDGVVRDYVRTHTDIEYRTLDFAGDLHPDIFGSVESIPIEENSFDLVCAFEVLEHLPFEKFEPCLLEMKRISKKYVIISMPHSGPAIKLLLKLPKLRREIKWAWKTPSFRNHIFLGEHYWEIGRKGYSAKRIKQILARHFTLRNDFVPFENQYHHFYVLEK